MLIYSNSWYAKKIIFQRFCLDERHIFSLMTWYFVPLSIARKTLYTHNFSLSLFLFQFDKWTNKLNEFARLFNNAEKAPSHLNRYVCSFDVGQNVMSAST